MLGSADNPTFECVVLCCLIILKQVISIHIVEEEEDIINRTRHRKKGNCRKLGHEPRSSLVLQRQVRLSTRPLPPKSFMSI